MSINIDYSNILWILAFALLVVGIISRVLWLFFASAVLWVVAGIYLISNAGANTFMAGLGWIMIGAGIGSAFTPVALRQKKQETIVNKLSRAEYLAQHRDKVRTARNSRIRSSDD